MALGTNISQPQTSGRDFFFFKLSDTKDCMVQLILAVSAAVVCIAMAPLRWEPESSHRPSSMGIQGLGLWAPKARRRENTHFRMLRTGTPLQIGSREGILCWGCLSHGSQTHARSLTVKRQIGRCHEILGFSRYVV